MENPRIFEHGLKKVRQSVAPVAAAILAVSACTNSALKGISSGTTGAGGQETVDAGLGGSGGAGGNPNIDAGPCNTVLVDVVNLKSLDLPKDVISVVGSCWTFSLKPGCETSTINNLTIQRVGPGLSSDVSDFTLFSDIDSPVEPIDPQTDRINFPLVVFTVDLPGTVCLDFDVSRNAVTGSQHSFR